MGPLAYGSFVFAFVVTLDQASKALLLRQAEQIRLGPALRLRRVVNADLVFGLRPTRARLLVLWGLAVSSVLLLATVDGAVGRPSYVGIGAALGGASGNLLDRLLRGGVIDFIDVRVWPVFNLADVAITVGVGVVLLAELM